MKLHLTFLYGVLHVFSADPALELKSITTASATTHPVEAGASNIIFQSNDGGKTWQDISAGLPAHEQPEDFFAGESGVYVRINRVLYRSKGNLKTPVWEKETGNADDPLNTSNVIESDGVLIATGQKGIMRSTDKGEHWQWVISEGGVGIAVERIEGGFAAIAYNTTIKSRRIHISLDNGKTWQAIGQGLRPSPSISSIKQVGNALLCGHPDGIFRSPDMGKTWTKVHSGVEEFAVEKAGRAVGADENEKVFKLYVSGDTVYAVVRDAGC